MNQLRSERTRTAQETANLQRLQAECILHEQGRQQLNQAALTIQHWFMNLLIKQAQKQAPIRKESRSKKGYFIRPEKLEIKPGTRSDKSTPRNMRSCASKCKGPLTRSHFSFKHFHKAPSDKRSMKQVISQEIRKMHKRKVSSVQLSPVCSLQKD